MGHCYRATRASVTAQVETTRPCCRPAKETRCERIARRGRLESDEIVRLALQIASGLEAAHKRGIIYRVRSGDELDYNPNMRRFAIEHLPRTLATYHVTPVDYNEARTWLAGGEVTSLVRTTELIGAIRAGLGVALDQSDTLMALQPGDEVLLISLSFSVLLAWAQGNIVPLDEDWRCLLLQVENPPVAISPRSAAISQDLTSNRAE